MKKQTIKEENKDKIVSFIRNDVIIASRTVIINFFKYDLNQNLKNITIDKYLRELVDEKILKQPKYGFYEINDYLDKDNKLIIKSYRCLACELVFDLSGSENDYPECPACNNSDLEEVEERRCLNCDCLLSNNEEEYCGECKC